MRSTGTIRTLLVAGAAVSWAAGLIAAEPSGSQGGSPTLVASITEGPDPIPRVIWAPTDRIYPEIPTVPGRDDGRPDVFRDAAGNVIVTWAYRDGADYDVALLRWNGLAWAPVEFVTAGGSDEIDPRAAAGPGGQLHVVWWVAGPAERVYHAQGPPGALGYRQLVATDARRPAVAVVNGAPIIAWERTSGDGRQQIVVASRGFGGTFLPAPLFEVERSEPLDVALHYEGGVLWMDWKASDTEMAYSKRVRGLWTAPITVPWQEPTWEGSEEIRRDIRRIVLNP